MKEGEIIIEFNRYGSIKSVKGCCKAKDFKAQIEKLRGALDEV